MHILVATDGSIDPDKAANFARMLGGPEGLITVSTVVRVPRTLLSDLRTRFGEMSPPHVDLDAEYVGASMGPRDGVPPRSWPGDDAIVAQYLGDKRIERCRPIVEAIRSTGGTAESMVREGDDVAADIVALAAEIEADVIVVGSHGGGGFQGLLGSTGAKVVRRATCPVLVIR
jgi:nucleotide-binding universal stress UspA family protein